MKENRCSFIQIIDPPRMETKKEKKYNFIIAREGPPLDANQVPFIDSIPTKNYN